MTEKTRYQSQVQIADGVHKIRHVFIRDMVIDCSIGIYTHEKEHEQRVRINLDLAVGEGDHQINDDIRNVISYEDMAKGVEAIIATGHINLVETLAENIAEMCLQDKRVFSARVRVEKLDIIASAESVGVEIERLNTD
ncbi:MAG: dihydroneopterin aldolase [Rhodospirillales bacterium]|nr:dihydroneopterin aldolase [Rhodospirillales bacterium]